MKFSQSLLLAITASLAAGFSTASAHIGVSGRIFNYSGIGQIGNAIDGGSFNNHTQTISSGFGWADATDANWGDSHRTRVFKFTLGSTQTVAITIARNLSGSGPNGTFLPAFSLFQTSSFQNSTHDSGSPTVSYLTGLFGTGATGESFVNTNGSAGREAGDPFVDSNSNLAWDLGEQYTDLNGSGVWEFGDPFTDTNGNGVFDGAGLGGSGKEGAFRALAPWKIYQDISPFAEMFFDTLIGHAADGTTANYGTAPGINGDGIADGTVTETFTELPVGDYYFLVGGADYAAQNSADVLAGGTTFRTYGVDVNVTAVPEPTSAALLGASAVGLVLVRRPRRRSA